MSAPVVIVGPRGFLPVWRAVGGSATEIAECVSLAARAQRRECLAIDWPAIIGVAEETERASLREAERLWHERGQPKGGERPNA